ncbi:MAG: glycosyltransferase family 2 protein [Chitinophagaceae bacterium]|nr:MAG: glycosyltransferase family 2 protein [Chitinophagaceae bacterium]
MKPFYSSKKNIVSQLHPFISICIPTYNRTDGLLRLLKSIEIQSFQDFEIVITDDSSNDDVFTLIKNKYDHLPIKYFKNISSLGTPENWNEGVRKAKGAWIKIMHDDDWFSTPQALEIIVAHVKKTKKLFLFSNYTDVILDEDKKIPVKAPSFWLEKILKDPVVLWARNHIGPPSVTMYHSSINMTYDKDMKWLVDIDFYRRVMNEYGGELIPEQLICVGVGSTQVTQYVKYELPLQATEHLLYLNKLSEKELNNYWVFDYNWRFIRNFNIKSTNELLAFNKEKALPKFLIKIIQFQKRVPKPLLRWGVSSKILMSICYRLLKPIKK